MPIRTERDSAPLRGVDLPANAASALSRMTATINDAERVWDQRAELMSRLHEEGYSFAAMAKATGVSREAVRKSILRWRQRVEKAASA